MGRSKMGTKVKDVMAWIILIKASMEIPNEEQSDNTIILPQNLIYSYLN